ncbi:MAG: glycosyltransferase 87 family protein, partial [Acidimicrobiia bacterium]|nr:glycosyltransferase 87 family protein [Acidimicrobiia bacterium]
LGGAGDRVVDRLLSKPMVAVAVAVRLVAATVLVLGPWTDEPADVAGWDIERFVAILAVPGRLWRDAPVEYPPGSVLVFKALDWLSPPGMDAVIGAHRVLVVLALAADLALAWLLARQGRDIAAWYLVLGLPLVPMGLLRLDVIVTLLAAGAALMALNRGRRPGRDRARGPAWADGAVGLLAAAAIMVKVWPGLLIPSFWALRRHRSTVAALTATALAVLTWLGWADAGFEPVRQVVELRGATGWHLESVGGVLTSLAVGTGLWSAGPGQGPRLELNAYRTGILDPAMVTAARALAVAAFMALAVRGRRALASDGDQGRERAVLGAVVLGSTAALLVSSPLLSPQFLLWLTPWAAFIGSDQDRTLAAPVTITLAATTITGMALAVFGPPDLHQPSAAVALAVRNGLLLALPISCWRWLGRPDRRPAD